MVLGLWLLDFLFRQHFCKDQRPKTKDQSPKNERSKILPMPDQITVYEKPTCTKCREMDRFLRESGVDFSKVNYYLEPLSKKQLAELLRKMKLKPRDILRTSEPIYRELGLGKKELSDSELIALMIEHPDLIQRPIVERGDRAVLGRPTENVKALL
ncbi:MAG: hypothetical protein QOD75_3969 [Blastocatellia bacterium]|nr:hypothetical protein [Blastocatellia bacterium]